MGGDGKEPHRRMMTATPRARTRARSYYADLDVSVIDEMPPGRTPVITKLVRDERSDEVIERIRAACMAGQQAYWVCPLVEESEKIDLAAVQERAVMLRQALGLNVGLMHGKMKAAERDAAMAAFTAGETQPLVAN